MLLETFCETTQSIWELVGKIVTIFKIVIPVIIVVLGIVALGKAIISDEEKDMKTAISGLLRKFIIAVVIFFLPTIVIAIFQGIGGAWETNSGEAADFVKCVKCVAGNCNG